MQQSWQTAVLFLASPMDIIYQVQIFKCYKDIQSRKTYCTAFYMYLRAQKINLFDDTTWVISQRRHISVTSVLHFIMIGKKQISSSKSYILKNVWLFSLVHTTCSPNVAAEFIYLWVLVPLRHSRTWSIWFCLYFQDDRFCSSLWRRAGGSSSARKWNPKRGHIHCIQSSSSFPGTWWNTQICRRDFNKVEGTDILLNSRFLVSFGDC